MGLNDPNRLILSRVARALGDLRESLVFDGRAGDDDSRANDTPDG